MPGRAILDQREAIKGKTEMIKTIFAVDPGTVSGWAVMTVEAEPKSEIVARVNFKNGYPQTAFAMVGACLPYKIDPKFYNKMPAHVAIEGQYLDEGNRRNVDSLIKLARKAGRWEEAACAHGLTYEYIQPSVWITAELGRGLRSDQVAKLAKEKCEALYGVSGLSEHEYSAILIGRYVAIREYRKNLQLTISTERSNYKRG